MSINRQSWRSPRLVLYAIVFRILCRVALRAGERAPMAAPRQVERLPGSLRKGASPLPLKLEPGQ